MLRAIADWWSHLPAMRASRHLEEWLLKPVTGGATAALTVLAGAFASFFQKEIETHLLLWPWADASSISWKATTFWFSVFAVGFLLGGSQWAQSRQTRRGRIELDGAIRRIESLPPENFLTEYQALLRRASNSVLVGATQSDGIESIDQAVRNVLQAIIGVVRAYDTPSQSAFYAANVMLYRAERPLEAKKAVDFVDNIVGHPDYDGLLELIQSLSTSEHEANSGPDRHVSELIVPVPRDITPVRNKNMVEMHPVLPGAAWAFVRREFAGFDTIEKLDHWLEERCSASGQNKERIRAYFGKGGAGAHIQSFASMPLFALGPAGETARPLGVLNLHSEQPGLAAERGGDRLSPLMEPFRMMLSILLTARGAYSPADKGSEK